LAAKKGPTVENLTHKVTLNLDPNRLTMNLADF